MQLILGAQTSSVEEKGVQHIQYQIYVMNIYLFKQRTYVQLMHNAVTLQKSIWKSNIANQRRTKLQVRSDFSRPVRD